MSTICTFMFWFCFMFGIGIMYPIVHHFDWDKLITGFMFWLMAVCFVCFKQGYF